MLSRLSNHISWPAWLASRIPFLKKPLGLSGRRRVPVVRQMSIAECGAACLCMILNYYGRRTRLLDCRAEMGGGRDGVTAAQLARVARAHGLNVKAYAVRPPELMNVPLPAIIHWEFKHFLVVESWSPKKIKVVDPARGRRDLTPAQLADGFTGVVLTLEPTEEFERRSMKGRPLWRDVLSKYIIGSRGALAQIVVTSVLLQLLGLALPLFTKVLVDDILPQRAYSRVTIFGVGMLLLLLSQTAIGYLRSRLLIGLQMRLDTKMMFDFFGHLLTLPYSFFQERASGDLLLRLGSNSVIREILTNQMLSLILDGSLFIFYLLIIFTQSLSFGLLVLGIGLLQVLLLLVSNGRVQTLTQNDLAAQSETQSYLVEALSRMEILKASGVEGRVMDRWSGLFLKQLRISVQRNEVAALIETGMTALRMLSPLCLLWIGAYRVLDGTMSLGTMLALNTLAAAFLMPLAALVSNAQRLQLVGSHLERIADVLGAAPDQDAARVSDPPTLTGQVELKGVSFRYGSNAPLILNNITFSIAPGQKVAIVGQTGSGKSTLGKLLLGLYPLESGEILYDGKRLEEMNYSALRRQFGVVLQDIMMFNNTIRQNIAFNDPELPFEQIVEAARLAAIHDDIVSMPLGYETLVAEGSPGFAGGQCQRLAIARALVHKPAFLILDEATSHLDALTERLVEQNLSRLSCTRIVIAHRLSTVRNADFIMVLSGGELVEQGTHEELLALQGHYAELFHAQEQ
jgi:ABC-type bacteriocin/lantibiotic exporter with double-glycine peptidase domain